MLIISAESVTVTTKGLTLSTGADDINNNGTLTLPNTIVSDHSRIGISNRGKVYLIDSRVLRIGPAWRESGD